MGEAKPRRPKQRSESDEAADARRAMAQAHARMALACGAMTPQLAATVFATGALLNAETGVDSYRLLSGGKRALGAPGLRQRRPQAAVQHQPSRPKQFRRRQ